MTPSDPRPAKRKTPDESNPLLAASKRSKKEPKANTSKRKFAGEEKTGGLVIIRGSTPRSSPPPTNQPSQISVAARPSSRPPSSQSQRPIASSSQTNIFNSAKPSQNRPKLDPPRPAGTAKDRLAPIDMHEDPEMEEDVRRMNSEAEYLRRRSQGNLTVDLSHRIVPSSTPSRFTHADALRRIPESESPQIQRNKRMREGSSRDRQSLHHQTQQHTRRSSISMRGKRISSSFETTGVITQPHTSVSDASLHKHIDCDLPEPHRVRQLLIWATARAMSKMATNTQSGTPPDINGNDPPQLDQHAQRTLHTVQEDMMRFLAEGQMDMNVWSANFMEGPESEQGLFKKPLKRNEQNVKNRAREIAFTEQIERAKAEDEAWSQADQFYNSYRTSSQADLERRRRTFLPPSSVKGKERAASSEPSDEWRWLVPRTDDLDEVFTGHDGLGLAKSVLEEHRTSTSEDSPGGKSPLDQRMDDVQFKIDSLFVFLNSGVQTTNVAEADLDRRFSILSLALSSRAQSVPPAHSHKLLSFPLSSSNLHETSSIDPQDVLRALTRIDKERPPGQVGDAAWRAAREVQRIQEDGSAGVGERRLTNLGPHVGTTPRKVPGTPRRKER